MADSSSSYKSAEKNVKIPSQMQAIVVDENTKKLVLDSVATPKLRPQEVLIKVEASAVNRADLLQASGKYPPLKNGLFYILYLISYIYTKSII